MQSIKVSLIASAVREEFYLDFFKSLEGTTVEYEVVFAGHKKPAIRREYPNLKYIETGYIKPAQCYEIARRESKGETVCWVADDCEFTHDLIGKAYRFWKEQNNEKVILSIQTFENGQFCNMHWHAFFGWKTETPLMAPLGLMGREYLSRLGGFDRRYVCGQYENDVAMRAYADGGNVVIFGDLENRINIDHYAKHGIKRPFATGYNTDREVLENSWTNENKKCVLTRMDKFEPYEDKDILTVSQSNRGQWS